MDLSESIIPKSDQLDYSDFIAGPRTLTITEVRRGPSAEQPVEIAVAEFERAWRPSKSMRRVLVHAWGSDSANYIGRRMTLFGDPSVKWGGIAIGGIRLSHLSHITKRLTIALTETRGKRSPYTVDPLAEPVKRDFLAEAEAANGDADKLRALWIDAKAANEPQAHLDTIAAMVAPVEASAS